MKNSLLHGIKIMIVIGLTLAPIAVYSDDLYEEVSTDERLYVRGVVRSVTPEAHSFVIRPTKGKLISISIDEQTDISGFKSLDELEKNNQVKVWYIPDGESDRAVRVQKLMDLGC